MTTWRDRRFRGRRWVNRNRRPVAAALTFGAVLCTTLALASAVAPPRASPSTPPSRHDLPEGLVAAPIRLADPGVAALLEVGDVVDVVAVDGHGRATVVASETLVVEAPAPGSSGSFGAPASDVVVVGVPPVIGVALAAAGSTGVLSVLLHPNG